MDPRRLFELLQICTYIAQGAEKLSEGQSSEALSVLQTASSLPASKTLVAYTHLLSGSCLAHMSHPQMALQCYRKALETDSWCVCALYQSMLIYRQLSNTQAEIQALRLLHSTLMLPSATEPALAGTHLLSPSLLLCGKPLSSLLSVPSALFVLHSLAQKCVIHGRVSEGVECYLDLLNTLHSEDQHGVRPKILLLQDTLKEVIMFLPDGRICSSVLLSVFLSLRCILRSTPSPGCLSFTWRQALLYSWPDGPPIAWRCVMKSSARHWSCCQISWCWRSQRRSVRLRPGLWVKTGWGCCSGLGLPTSSRVTATLI
ncbi:Fanconi anemia group G protein -like protein [Collichthys lucidus]|uniref:Fanconi anemia group G protein-like protein n=1 Tax=Collichthys lucidus TaxID=240159 RepID=A0A4U5UY89_COLLU|nr:Fanconi anemia group G protein -like protein [Collichthys lucidus]